MRSTRPLALALALTFVLPAASAMAGPAGSGLAHTEAVARKAAEARTTQVVRLTPARDCVPAAVSALRDHDAVKNVTVEDSDLSIKVHTDAKTARAGALEDLVAKTCAAPTAAAAG